MEVIYPLSAPPFNQPQPSPLEEPVAPVMNDEKNFAGEQHFGQPGLDTNSSIHFSAKDNPDYDSLNIVKGKDVFAGQR